MSEFWDARYAGADFAYGDQPNDFLRESVAQIPRGRVLCIAEGEGRNAVFLAERGYDVTAMDQSAVGLAKARGLAETRGVTIEAHVANLDGYELGEACWQGVVSSWVHLPRALRVRVHRGIVRALAKGGVLVLEAYSPAQLAFGTGGPKDPDMLYDEGMLRDDFAGLEIVTLVSREREVNEGKFHGGRSAVVQLVAKKPT